MGRALNSFEALKHWIVQSTGLAKDALHIHITLAIFVGVLLLWRWRNGWIAAWVAAAIFAIGGEILDIFAEIYRSDIQPDGAHWHDIWNGMLWPTLLALLLRYYYKRPDSGDLTD